MTQLIEQAEGLVLPGAECGAWYVLHVRSRQEKVVADELGSMEIGCFLPLQRCVRYYGPRKAVVHYRALFDDLLDAKVGLLPNGQPRRSLIRFVKDRPGHDRRYAIDASKIRNELGWEPSLTFEQGIDQTIDWYLEHREWVAEVTSGAYREYYEKQYGKS